MGKFRNFLWDVLSYIVAGPILVLAWGLDKRLGGFVVASAIIGILLGTLAYNAWLLLIVIPVLAVWIIVGSFIVTFGSMMERANGFS